MMMPSTVAITRAAFLLRDHRRRTSQTWQILWWFAGTLKIPNRRQGSGDDDEPSYLAPEQVHACTIRAYQFANLPRAGAFFSRPTGHTIEHLRGARDRTEVYAGVTSRQPLLDG